MHITLDIPDQYIAQFEAGAINVSQAALEAFALQGYRDFRFSEAEVGAILGYASRWEVWELLAAYKVPRQYTAEDLQMDIAASDAISADRPEAVHAA